MKSKHYKLITIGVLFVLSFARLSNFVFADAGDGEENDTFHQAYWLDINSFYDNFTQEDDDWYYVDLAPSDNLTVILSYNTSLTWMHMDVYDNNSVYIASGQIKDSEVIAGYYNFDPNWVRVYLKVYGNNASIPYTLETKLENTDVLLADYAEPNDQMNDSYYLDGPDFYGGYFYIQNEDWYDFILHPHEEFRLDAYYDTYTNLNVELYSDNGTFLGTSFPDGDTLQAIEYSNPTDSEQHLYLRFTGNETEWYQFELTIWQSHENDDSYEYYGSYENDYKHTLTYVSTEIFDEKKPLINWDDDWYSIYWNNDYWIDLELWADNSTYFEINAFYGNGTEIGTAYKHYDMEMTSLSFQAFAYNDICFKVSGNNLGDFYHLNVLLDGDDRFEDNDFRYHANMRTPLTNDLYKRLLQFDDDWYRISLNPGDYLEVNLLYKNSTSNLSVSLYEYPENLLATDFSFESYRKLEFNLTGDADYYYLKVSGDDTGATYTLDIRLNGWGFDDFAEENDDFGQAYDLGSSGYTHLELWDEDWYKIRIPAESVMDMNIYGSADEIMEYELYLENETYLYTLSQDMYGDIYFNYTNYADTGMYLYLRVSGNFMGQSYTFDYWYFDAEIDDWAEPNDDRASAVQLGNGYNGNLVSWNADYYKILVNSTFTLRIDLFYNTSYSPYFYMELQDENGGYMLSDHFEDDHLVIEWQNTKATAEWIYLYVSSNYYGDWYDLSINCSLIIQDDWLEPNDSPSEAQFFDASMFPVDYYNLLQWDQDWYSFFIEAGNKVDVFVYYDTMLNTSLDVELYYTNGTLIDIGTENEELDVNKLSWRNPYSNGVNVNLLVNGPGIGDPYSLYIDEFWVGDIQDDDYEPNDNMGEAAFLELPGLYYLELYNDDWFWIHLLTGDTIDLHLETDMYTDIFLEFYDSTGILESYYVSQEGFLDFSFTAAYEDDFYILVSSSTSEVWYDLKIDLNGESGDPYTDDGYEPNDSFGEAEYITPDYYWLTSANEDWFYIDVLPGEHLIIDLYCDAMIEDDFVLELYDASNNFMYPASHNGAGQYTIEWTNEGTQMEYIYIMVDQHTTNSQWYDLDIKLEPAETTDQDDWMEENDEYYNAHLIQPPGRWEDLINLDEDYFEFDLIDGEIAKIHVFCEPHSSLGLEDVHPGDGGIIQSDYSTEDGELFLEIKANGDGRFVIAVIGDNSGEIYTLDVQIENDDSSSTQDPSYDWVAFSEGDWAEWSVDVHFDDDGGDRGVETYNGTFRSEIVTMGLDSDSVWVDANMIWTNIPSEFLQDASDFHSFNIQADGWAFEPYFGFANPFVGIDFRYDASQEMFGSDFDINIFDEGRSLELNYIGTGQPWFRMTITYNEDGLLEFFQFEGEMVDELGNVYGKASTTLSLRDSSLSGNQDEDTKPDTDQNPVGNETSNPFGDLDLSGIPGFPIEIVGVSVFGAIALIAIIMKKKLK